MTHDNNDVVEKAITAAKDIGHEKAKNLLAGINSDSFEEIDTEYPTVLTDGSAPPAIEVVRELHQGYVDRIAAINLTNSLMLALGYETPSNHSLNIDTLKGLVSSHKETLTVIELETKNGYRGTFSDNGDMYTFLDTDERLCYLRAVHFAITRHDPDMTEIINRQLAAKAGLTTPDYLENADAATQARAANTGTAE